MSNDQKAGMFARGGVVNLVQQPERSVSAANAHEGVNAAAREKRVKFTDAFMIGACEVSVLRETRAFLHQFKSARPQAFQPARQIVGVERRGSRCDDTDRARRAKRRGLLNLYVGWGRRHGIAFWFKARLERRCVWTGEEP